MNQKLDGDTLLKVYRIAQVCHEANRAWCKLEGDNSQKQWDDAPEWQRESAIQGVAFRLSNPDAPNSAQHEAWLEDKVKNGWVYGNEKDIANRTHPCIVQYDELPEFQKKKDALFTSIVNALK